MRVNILGVTIDAMTMEQTVAAVDQYISQRKPLHLMGVNADKINSTIADPVMRELVNQCGIVNADGASVILASKALGCPLPERVAGIDLMQNLVTLCERKKYNVYLLGAKQEVVGKTAQVLVQRHASLDICGIQNGYFADSDWPQIADQIKEQSPHMVFIGITSPKKEYLIQYFLDYGLNCVFMGVGGSFDVLSGTIARAPVWMQKMNLEWLFRLIQEPKRLLKRYFVGNATFIGHVIKARIKG